MPLTLFMGYGSCVSGSLMQLAGGSGTDDVTAVKRRKPPVKVARKKVVKYSSEVD